ncbi:hypothetical protein BVRB_9g218360 [Beta vulgaris subsp. vulgaris]|uniref:B3 domain-containing protein At1g49475 n=1 Tax=Beta vulgaris subsp. vulgaris TaxID=3555 RepID=UPI00053FF0D7|nr:B3 domain-containing protein At1g49475 [Beta vulgaris subsp. vulgaris]KMT00538.1 hypothetical protein BVRB_9g218360 [Beta vulgaris subsp. vulgaris]
MVRVKKRRREKPPNLLSFSGKPFRFFKIILHCLQEDRLKIPEKFAKKFSSQLSTVVTLTIPTGLSWKIRLSRCTEDKLYFDKGWPIFMEQTNIKHGYFLEFEYEGNNHFEVHIFSLSCCEIDYPIHQYDDHQRRKQNRNDDFKVKEEQENEEDEEKNDIHRATTMSKNKCKKPSFTITTRKYCVSYLHMPKSFTNEHMKGKSYKFANLQLGEGKKWRVTCYFHSESFRLIGPGWKKFRQENNWSEGESYTFVLVDKKRNSVTFKVFKV